MCSLTAFSHKDLPEAVADLKAQCGEIKPRLILCFAAPRYDLSSLSRQMQTEFPNACVVGCSTAGEICDARMLTDSVVALFLDEDVVEDVAWGVVLRISEQVNVKDAFSSFERHYQIPVSAMAADEYVGLVLVDGMSGGEERLMEKIGDRCDLSFIGGAAGDDLQFRRTEVMVQGEAYTDAAVLLLIKPKRGFGIIKTQSFYGIGKTLMATAVDETAREVIEFNHEPAIDAYAKALGVSWDELPSLFMRHPLGLIIDGEPFVRSPQRIHDGALAFYCKIPAGTELEVLDATDIVEDTRRAVDNYEAKHGPASALVDFHCIQRTLQLRQENRCPEYGQIYKDRVAIGFSTYGEEYIHHINQTSTILVLH